MVVQAAAARSLGAASPYLANANSRRPGPYTNGPRLYAEMFFTSAAHQNSLHTSSSSWASSISEGELGRRDAAAAGRKLLACLCSARTTSWRGGEGAWEGECRAPSEPGVGVLNQTDG